MPIALPVAPEANELLSRNALALLIAMLLDQQVSLERAFSAPADLVARLGHEPTPKEFAAFGPGRVRHHLYGTAGPPSLPQGDGRGPGPGDGPHHRRGVRR